MVNQLTAEGDGLRLFFTDDIYLVDEQLSSADAELAVDAVSPVISSAPMPTEQPETLKFDFKYLGKNQKNILILVNDAEHEVSDEAGKELLRKIVKAINLSANDFALLNYHNYQGASYAQLMDHFSSTLVFAFGVSTERLKLPAHPMNAVVSQDGVKLVFSAELKVLNGDQKAKKELWGSLQQLGL